MNYTELEDVRLEIEYFDNPDYNYDDNEDEILDLSVELNLDDEEGGDLWDGFIDQCHRCTVRRESSLLQLDL